MPNLLSYFKNYSTVSKVNNIKNVTVIGARIKGTGISQVTAQAGQNVVLVDSNPELLKNAKQTIRRNLVHAAKKQKLADTNSYVEEVMNRIQTSTKVEDGLKADLIVEDVIDNLKIKQELFEKLDELAPPHTILSSNPTSLSVNAIGAEVKRKDRYGGLHFFNPVPAMKLLEVIKSDYTSEETYHTMLAWGKAIGKTCITCKDTPGFVVNRLMLPYGAEALRIYERGDATKEDIDTAMKLGVGYPMGPFELLDYAGLDTSKIAFEVMYELTKNPIFRPVPVLDQKVADGKLGIKSGEGFYKYK